MTTDRTHRAARLAAGLKPGHCERPVRPLGTELVATRPPCARRHFCCDFCDQVVVIAGPGRRGYAYPLSTAVRPARRGR